MSSKLSICIECIENVPELKCKLRWTDKNCSPGHNVKMKNFQSIENSFHQVNLNKLPLNKIIGLVEYTYPYNKYDVYQFSCDQYLWCCIDDIHGIMKD